MSLTLGARVVRSPEAQVTISVDCTTKFGHGTLKTVVGVCLARSARYTREIYALFYLKIDGEDWVQIGDSEGTFIDRAFVDPETESKLWVKECLQRGGYNLDPVIRDKLHLLYAQCGQPKQGSGPASEALNAEKLVYIDMFSLERRYRHGGLGTHALQGLLTAPVELTSGPTCTSTALLSPDVVDTRFDGHEACLKHHRDLDKFYGKLGFTTFQKTDEDDPSSSRVLGRVL